MALLSTLPNTTYDLPDSNVPSGLANGAPTIKSSKPSPLTSPAGAYTADPSSGANAGKSYVVFGKSDSSAINLSVIAINHKAP
jgi:hypothetical protein